MFSGASNFVEGVDTAFAFIFGVSIFFIIAITAFMIYTLIRFKRSKVKNPRQFRGSITLELIWTIVPTILVLLMFYYGYMGFAPMRNVPDDAMEIDAIGRMWEWEFVYENGKSSRDLVIPVNRPVKLNLKSEDVNHSLFIPAFRVKEDLVPGYDNYMWFTPYYIGDYEILCTEYCGLLHSAMTAEAKVLDSAEFDQWYANLSAQKEDEKPEGFEIAKTNGCFACHSRDGSKLVGSSFKGIFGSEKTVITDGKERKIIVDEEYLKNSILNPNQDVVKGYNKGLMQSYEGVISDEDIDKIVAYLKTEKK
jgi:cytochrome c oxidase subunit 2